MKTHLRALTALGLLSLGLVAFAGRSSVAGPPPPEASPQAKAKVALEHNLRAPLVVTFDERATELPSGELEIAVHLDVRTPLSFPVSMAVTPPRGASLTSGAASETLELREVGRVTKLFRFRGPAAPTAADPFRVVVHGEAADQSMGLHADRTFPAQPELKVPAFSGPRLPGGRPPGPLKK